MPRCMKGNLLRRVSDGRRRYPLHSHIVPGPCPEWED